MIFGTLNPEKIWHEQLTDLSTSPVIQKIKGERFGDTV